MAMTLACVSLKEQVI